MNLLQLANYNVTENVGLCFDPIRYSINPMNCSVNIDLIDDGLVCLFVYWVALSLAVVVPQKWRFHLKVIVGINSFVFVLSRALISIQKQSRANNEMNWYFI